MLLFAWYVVLVLLLVKITFKLTNGVCRSQTCLVGKTALITGGNSGIGFETALGLASRGCRVIIASRTSDTKAASEIIRRTQNKRIVAKHLDLSSFRAIRQFVDDLMKCEQGLDILINNAGVAGVGNILTEDGLQVVMQVNHFGPFLLTTLLLPLLRRRSSGRIIFTSSMLSHLHCLNNISNVNDLYAHTSLERSVCIDFRMYANSKLCNMVLAKHFAHVLRGTGITSNVIHPGIVHTPIYALAFSSHISSIFSQTFYALCSFLLKDGFEGAQTTLHVALDPELHSTTGKFFYDCEQFIMPPIVYNRVWRQAIIAKTILLTQVTEKELLGGYNKHD